MFVSLIVKQPGFHTGIVGRKRILIKTDAGRVPGNK